MQRAAALLALLASQPAPAAPASHNGRQPRALSSVLGPQVRLAPPVQEVALLAPLALQLAPAAAAISWRLLLALQHAVAAGASRGRRRLLALLLLLVPPTPPTPRAAALPAALLASQPTHAAPASRGWELPRALPPLLGPLVRLASLVLHVAALLAPLVLQSAPAAPAIG